jgi:hypothetical protein
MVSSAKRRILELKKTDWNIVLQYRNILGHNNCFLVHDAIKHFIFPYFFKRNVWNLTLLAFPYHFTFQLTFLSYFPYHFTIQPTFLPHFPYHFTIFFCIFHIFFMSYHYSTYFSSVFSISFSQFNLLFFHIFHIISLFNLAFFHIFHRCIWNVAVWKSTGKWNVL